MQFQVINHVLNKCMYIIKIIYCNTNTYCFQYICVLDHIVQIRMIVREQISTSLNPLTTAQCSHYSYFTNWVPLEKHLHIQQWKIYIYVNIPTSICYLLYLHYKTSKSPEYWDFTFLYPEKNRIKPMRSSKHFKLKVTSS